MNFQEALSGDGLGESSESEFAARIPGLGVRVDLLHQGALAAPVAVVFDQDGEAWVKGQDLIDLFVALRTGAFDREAWQIVDLFDLLGPSLIRTIDEAEKDEGLDSERVI